MDFERGVEDRNCHRQSYYRFFRSMQLFSMTKRGWQIDTRH